MLDSMSGFHLEKYSTCSVRPLLAAFRTSTPIQRLAVIHVVFVEVLEVGDIGSEWQEVEGAA